MLTNTQLDYIAKKIPELRGEMVSVFMISLHGASMHITGKLIGGDLPGEPFGVVHYNENNFQHVNISFQINAVKSIQLTPNQNIINLH